MNLIKEKSNLSNLTRFYVTDSLSSISDLAKWLSSLKDVSGISVADFTLSDLLNRSDEGSCNSQLAGDASYDDIYSAINGNTVDLISAYCSYNGKVAVIGANLNRHEIFITVRRKDMADIDSIEKELHLQEM